MSEDDSPGDLYVVLQREFIALKQPVYKIGRSQSATGRLLQYSKGSMLVAYVPVARMRDAESMLKVLCAARFKRRKDLGNEYFEGPEASIVTAMHTIAALFPIDATDEECHELASTYVVATAERGVFKLKQWIQDAVEVTGNPKDRMILADLRDACGADKMADCGVKPQNFVTIVKACFASAPGVQYKDVDSCRLAGAWVAKRGVFRGLRCRILQQI